MRISSMLCLVMLCACGYQGNGGSQPLKTSPSTKSSTANSQGGIPLGTSSGGSSTTLAPIADDTRGIDDAFGSRGDDLVQLMSSLDNPQTTPDVFAQNMGQIFSILAQVNDQRVTQALMQASSQIQKELQELKKNYSQTKWRMFLQRVKAIVASLVNLALSIISKYVQR